MSLIRPDTFINEVIGVVPRQMAMGGPAVEKLLFMIAAHESGQFNHREQIGGPALSFFQIEPETFGDIWGRYLYQMRPDLLKRVRQFLPDDMAPLEALKENDKFACAIARIKLWMQPEPLPDVSETWALAEYAKKYWNTDLGRANATKYFDDYNRAVIAMPFKPAIMDRW